MTTPLDALETTIRVGYPISLHAMREEAARRVKDEEIILGDGYDPRDLIFSCGAVPEFMITDHKILQLSKTGEENCSDRLYRPPIDIDFDITQGASQTFRGNEFVVLENNERTIVLCAAHCVHVDVF